MFKKFHLQLYKAAVNIEYVFAKLERLLVSVTEIVATSVQLSQNFSPFTNLLYRVLNIVDL